MNREQLTSTFKESGAENFILELATGFGKTRLALDKTAQWLESLESPRILIVVPRLVLINSWKDEIHKWKYDSINKYITYVTYVSFPKLQEREWDVIVFDEAHHISERCREFMPHIKAAHTLFLSATLKKEHKQFISYNYHPEIIKIDIRDAIKEDVLPDPKVILIKLKLDNRVVNQVIEKNINKKNTNIPIKTVGYVEKWKYRGYKGPLHILCTQQQYYDDASNLIEWYKQKGMHSIIMKNMWLHKSGDRLKWLAAQKELVVKGLIQSLRNYRTIVFCPSIEESSKIGCPCVNSKIGTGNLELFNSRRIKHIAAVGMLDEGEFAPISI